jgi:hypothetical protein
MLTSVWLFRVALLCAVNVLTVGRSCLSLEREPLVVPAPDPDLSVRSLIKDAFSRENQANPLFAAQCPLCATCCAARGEFSEHL